MADVPIQRHADWTRCRIENVHPRLVSPHADPSDPNFGLASLELLPDDLSSNPYFREIDALGDPDGFALELPQRPTGRLVFLGVEGEEETCQNLTPFPNAAHAWLGFQPVIKGFPYRKLSGEAPFGGARPGAPRVVDVPVGKGGYRGGDRIFYRCPVIDGLYGEPDEGVLFSVPQGFGFEVPAERGLPRGVRVAYFLTEEGDVEGGNPPSIDTAREQRVTSGGRRNVRFTGPYRRGRRLPTRNETNVRPPRRSVRRRDHRFSPKRGGDVIDAEIRVVRTYTTLRGAGETGASEPSKGFDLPGETRREERVVDGEKTTVEVYTGRTKDMMLVVDSPPKNPGCDGWKCYLVVNNQTLMAYRPGNPERAAGSINFGDKVEVHIDAATISGEAATRRNRAGDLPAWALVSQSPPGGADSELLVGLEPFEGSLEEPRTFKVSDNSFDAGANGRKITVRVADCYEDETGRLHQGLPSRRITHRVPANHAPMVVFDDPVNDLQNAEGRETGADGKPLGWSWAENNGSYTCEGGVHEISTAGPGSTSSSFWQLKDQDQTREEVFSGIFAAAMAQGTAEVVLEEYRVPVPEVRLAAAGQSNPSVPARTTVLAGVTGAAVRSLYGRIFGPPDSPSLGPDDVAWHPEMVSWRFACRMQGATRSGRASVTGPLAGPDGVAPRKAQKGGPHEPASFDADGFPEAAHVRGPFAALGPAPKTGGEAGLDPPIEDLAFSGGEPGPAWTKETEGGATAAAASLLDGTPVIATRDATQSRPSNARYRRSVAEWEDSGGLAVEEDLVSLTRNQSGYVERGRISDAAGNTMASVEYVAATGELRLCATDRRGNERREPTGQRIRDNEKRVSWEIVPTGGDTEEGRAVLLVGRNGADRRPAAVIGGIDWTGREPDRVLWGHVRESNPQIRSSFNVRRVRLSENGAPIGEAPGVSNPPPEDRPADPVSGSRIALDPDGEPILQWCLWSPPGREPFDTPVFWSMAALPGRTYSLGLERRHARYRDGFGPSRMWFVEVVAEDGRVLEVGSLHGPAPSDERPGWADRRLEEQTVVAVPEDFGAALITARHRDVAPGFYAWQRFAPSLGVAVKRGFGRAVEGSFSGVLDSRVPNADAHDVPLQEGWFGPRVAADVPPGCSVAPSYNSSDDGATFGDANTPDPLAVRERVFARVGAVLLGNGRDGPEVPPGGAALLTRPFESALLRHDGTQLDAGSVVYDLEEPFGSTIYETTLWDNRPEHEPTSSRVLWLPPFKVQVFSAAAKAELDANGAGRWENLGWLDREWRVEAPDRGPSGTCYRVVPGGPLSWSRKANPYAVGGKRYGLWEAQAPGAMVVESWPLGNPGGSV